MNYEPTQGQSDRNRLLNARVVVTLAVSLAVILAGCVGGLGGSDGEAGVAEGDTQGGGADGDANSASEDDSADGADESAENGNAAKANIEPRKEPWFNVTQNVYVFEVYDAKNGSGTITFEPNQTAIDMVDAIEEDPKSYDSDQKVAADIAMWQPITSYESDASLEKAHAAVAAEKGGDTTAPLLYPLSVAEMMALDASDDNLTVGYESTDETADGETLTTKVTGIESHGGVGCYVVEMTVDGEPLIEVCKTPGPDYPVYGAIYDSETGELGLEIKLVEMREA